MGHALQSLDAALAVSLRVEHHPFEEGPVSKSGDVDQILEGVDRLALLAYEQARVIRCDVSGDKPSRIVDLHPRLEVHGLEDRGHEYPNLLEELFGGLLDLFRLPVDLG